MAFLTRGPNCNLNTKPCNYNYIEIIPRRPRLPPPKGDSPSPRSDDNNNGTYLRPDSLIYDTVPDGLSVGSFSSSEEPERIEAESSVHTRTGRGDSPRRYKTEARIELGQRESL